MLTLKNENMFVPKMEMYSEFELKHV